MAPRCPKFDSVFAKIPIEILQSILLAGDIPEYPDDRPTVRSIRSVSRQWNDAAINTPELWTKIKIYDENLDRTGADSLSRWLDRSLNRPLNITLHFQDPYLMVRDGNLIVKVSQQALLSCISDKFASWSDLRETRKP